MGLVHNYCQKEPLNIVPFKEQVVSKVQTAKLICSMTGAQEQPPHPGSHSDGHLFCMQSDILKSITELLLGLRWTTEGLCLDHLFSAEWCGIGVSAEHSAKQIQGQASWFCKQALRGVHPQLVRLWPPFRTRSHLLLDNFVRSKWLPLESATQKINQKRIISNHLFLLWKPKEMLPQNMIRAISPSTSLRNRKFITSVDMYYYVWPHILLPLLEESSTLWDRVWLPLKKLKHWLSTFPASLIVGTLCQHMTSLCQWDSPPWTAYLKLVMIRGRDHMESIHAGLRQEWWPWPGSWGGNGSQSSNNDQH